MTSSLRRKLGAVERVILEGPAEGPSVTQRGGPVITPSFTCTTWWRANTVPSIGRTHGGNLVRRWILFYRCCDSNSSYICL